jgi:hypothetical protein
MWYEEGDSLNLDLFVQNFEDERESYWSDDEQGKDYLRLVDRIAKTLLRGSTDLVQPPQDFGDAETFSWDQAQWLADLDPVSGRVLERIEIDVAWEYSVDTRGMALRCLELARLVIAAQPNESVMRFLRRLSRCYIAGFLPECVMLCRAVAENALIEKFDRKSLPLPATPQGQSSMRSRLDAAVRFNLLSQRAADDLWVVWKRGSKAAHEDPEATQDVLGTIHLSMAGVIFESCGWRELRG